MSGEGRGRCEPSYARVELRRASFAKSKRMVDQSGIEPLTSCLQSRHSTTELLARFYFRKKIIRKKPVYVNRTNKNDGHLVVVATRKIEILLWPFWLVNADQRGRRVYKARNGPSGYLTNRHRAVDVLGEG